MTRRAFIPAAASAGLAAAAAEPVSRATIEIAYYKLRNTPENQRQRMSQFLERSYVPALRRAGSGPVGVFGNTISADGPFLMLLTSYPNLAGFERTRDKLSADAGFMKALEAFNAQTGLNYERGERWLLRGFEGFPQIEVPPGDSKRPARIFEVRQYESNNMSTLRRKMDMFNKGESAIFKKLGMQPVFFGEMIAGPKLPNLVYMLSYEDLAARDKAWRAFGSDPDWQKMRATPGWADAEIVSNITNFIVSPLAFSEIR
jgi:hypothetical protein